MAAKRISNRREFLQGRSAADALADRLAAGDDRPAQPHAAEPYLVHLSRRAMACQFEVLLNAGQHDLASETAIAAFDLIDELESQLTVYRDTSEVMAINRFAASEQVEVESRLFALLALAVRIFKETDGAFDITAGPLSKVWGFYRGAGAIPLEEDLHSALAAVGTDKIRLDSQQQTIAFLVPGVELNLGAIGKGYALDRAAERMEERGVRDFLWHGGQSSVLARGTRGGSDNGWRVGLGDPLRPERRLAEVSLRNRALGTSGASVQFFRHGGKRYGHILDPRTGWPAEGVFSATAIADSAAEADALATAFYTMGVEGSLRYCAERPEVGALLVHPTEDGSAVRVTTAGLANDDWRRVDSGG